MRIIAGSAPNRPDPGRFAVVGLIATIVDVGIAVGLESAGLARLPADLVALVLAAVVALRLHGEVTLRGDNLDRWIRQPPVFFTAAFLAGIVDVVVFVSLGSLSVLGAKLVAVAAAAVIRAGLHRSVLFRAVRREQGSPVARPPAPGKGRLSIIIPAFQEEARIADTITTTRLQLAAYDEQGDLEIVVVDDGSSDDTAAAAAAAGADLVVSQPENRGKGAAVRAGVEASTGRVVAFTDADLAYAPSQLVAFVEAVESGYDVVIGNRHHGDTKTLTGTSALRSFGSRVINMATNLMLLGNYRDTQCGCKAFRSDTAHLVLGAGTIDGFAFDIEVLHLVERYGFTMLELPVEVVNSDTSTVRALTDGVRVLLDIMRIRRAAHRGRYPIMGADVLPSASQRPSGRSAEPTPGGK